MHKLCPLRPPPPGPSIPTPNPTQPNPPLDPRTKGSTYTFAYVTSIIPPPFIPKWREKSQARG